jgi:hypothetical protein
LDNLAYALARLKQDPPENPKSIAFPIFCDQAEFNRKGRRSISQLPEAAASLIERLQPFQRNLPGGIGKAEEDLLLVLQLLNNLDKHQVPAIALLAPQEINFQASTEFQSEADAAENVPPNTEVWGGPLSPGVVLLEYKTTRPLASGSLDVKGSAIVKLVGLQDPVPLIPLAIGLHMYVDKVAQMFSNFFEDK